ncbi:3' terminal RNA ribose 2'-O-methyltransferase Hen1 [Yinghuangia seranimata]|uniref:3' terminal RNA ribose 2'-O-methyltransferase Hen1 n=1 Tax=Yinghuangia seranimata TaxID=408067 RepID=UPI00248CE5FC|nr:3' terminal RNA ribose 2'-O-methyltransferase Hen1 [Yinghuangia seranimata]MDI2128731.1 3' terminal RNA ribose 2'-O-methyltransferase Hen1 [Yinghuangia seranimata]
MFLTIATTRRPATELGFVLHKHPDKSQQFSASYGTAHVFYPEAGEERCEAALLLDVDPIALVRGTKKGLTPDFALAQYVNDRPYAASSLLAVALGGVFRTAMQGRCVARPELVDEVWPLEVSVPAVPSRGGAGLVRALFEPLGWTVEAEPLPLDERFPEWGDSRYVRLTLTGSLRVSDALRHLYVLLPVLDDAKHYWVAPDEVDKLLRAGDGWLAAHPERALIARRYLSRRPGLTRTALERLAEIDDARVEDLDNAIPEEAEDGDAEAGAVGESGAADGAGAVPADEHAVPAVGPAADSTAEPAEAKPPTLAALRRDAILGALRAAGSARVLDLGCGDAKLIGALLQDSRFTEIVGVDVSVRALTVAGRRLRLDRMHERQRARVKLMQGALTYTDARLVGYDAAVLCEVIEHVDEPRLPALEFAVFGAAKPGVVVVTTPNVEYNVRYAPEEEGGHGLAPGAMRHGDHRFEWDRARFRSWAAEVGERFGYGVEFAPVGDDDPEVGPPTQMAVFHAGAAAPRPAGPTAADHATEHTTEHTTDKDVPA